MKISKLFHWLYALLMFLPFVNVIALTLHYGFNDTAELPTVAQTESIEVDFNQLVENGNFESTLGWSSNTVNASFSVNDNVATMLASSSNGFIARTVSLVSGHKYFLSSEITLTTGSNLIYVFLRDTVAGISYTNFFTSSTTSKQIVSGIISASSSNERAYFRIVDGRTSDWDNIYIENCMLFDLTQMFGSDIADEIYQMESTTSGAGVEYFRSFYPNDYYAYTTSDRQVIGDFETVQTLDNISNHFWLPSLGGLSYQMNSVFDYLIGTIFGINVVNGIGYIASRLLSYWLLISIIYLIFDVIMYIPLLVHRWLDKGVME